MRARYTYSTVLLPGNDEQTSSARSFCWRPVFYARTKFVLQLCSCNVENVGWKESMTLCIRHLVSIVFLPSLHLIPFSKEMIMIFVSSFFGF